MDQAVAAQAAEKFRHAFQEKWAERYQQRLRDLLGNDPFRNVSFDDTLDFVQKRFYTYRVVDKPRSHEQVQADRDRTWKALVAVMLRRTGGKWPSPEEWSKAQEDLVPEYMEWIHYWQELSREEIIIIKPQLNALQVLDTHQDDTKLGMPDGSPNYTCGQVVEVDIDEKDGSLDLTIRFFNDAHGRFHCMAVESGVKLGISLHHVRLPMSPMLTVKEVSICILGERDGTGLLRKYDLAYPMPLAGMSRPYVAPAEVNMDEVAKLCASHPGHDACLGDWMSNWLGTAFKPLADRLSQSLNNGRENAISQEVAELIAVLGGMEDDPVLVAGDGEDYLPLLDWLGNESEVPVFLDPGILSTSGPTKVFDFPFLVSTRSSLTCPRSIMSTPTATPTAAAQAPPAAPAAVPQVAAPMAVGGGAAPAAPSAPAPAAAGTTAATTAPTGGAPAPAPAAATKMMDTAPTKSTPMDTSTGAAAAGFATVGDHGGGAGKRQRDPESTPPGLMSLDVLSNVQQQMQQLSKQLPANNPHLNQLAHSVNKILDAHRQSQDVNFQLSTQNNNMKQANERLTQSTMKDLQNVVQFLLGSNGAKQMGQVGTGITSSSPVSEFTAGFGPIVASMSAMCHLLRSSKMHQQLQQKQKLMMGADGLPYDPEAAAAAAPVAAAEAAPAAPAAALVPVVEAAASVQAPLANPQHQQQQQQDTDGSDGYLSLAFREMSDLTARLKDQEAAHRNLRMNQFQPAAAASSSWGMGMGHAPLPPLVSAAASANPHLIPTRPAPQPTNVLLHGTHQQQQQTAAADDSSSSFLHNMAASRFGPSATGGLVPSHVIGQSPDQVVAQQNATVRYGNFWS